MEHYKEIATNIANAEYKRLLHEEDVQWKDRALEAEKHVITLLGGNSSLQQKEGTEGNEDLRTISRSKLENFCQATQTLEKIKNNANNLFDNLGDQLKVLLFSTFLPMSDSPVRNSCIQLTVQLIIERVKPEDFHAQTIKEISEKEFEEKGAVKVLNIYAEAMPVLVALTLAEILAFQLQVNKHGDPIFGVATFMRIKKCFDALDSGIDQFNVTNVAQNTDKILRLHKVIQGLTESYKVGFGMKFAMVERRLQKSIVNFVTKFEELDRLQEDSIVQRVYKTMKRKIVPQFVLENC
eukprot:TRINITY_DN3240_c0_g3_i1.p1 TRINITY_DN3240_c0_g3~~TRINITY_DN3240_c0_g3_i1.p1  ORF type:complete len:295 (+),score=35.22 TRINITY_DN3240_c0_g3_i1:262-1146(+)